MRFWLLGVSLCLAGTTPAFAGSCDLEFETKLTVDEGAPSDHFGLALGIAGDTVVIGSHDDLGGVDSGAAFAFERVDGRWVRTTTLVPVGTVEDDHYGTAVSMSGSTVVIGAWGDDGFYDTGAAFVFDLVDGVWSPARKLFAPDIVHFDNFGSSVSISGDTILIGARGDDDSGPNAGAAYVFERGGDEWTQTAKLLAPDGASGDKFGARVAIDGGTAVIGAWRDADAGTASGSAHVFERVGGRWIHAAKLTASDADPFDYFGKWASVSGDTVLVGADGDDEGGERAGAAYVFDRTDDGWQQTAKLLAAGVPGAVSFGFPATLANDVAMIGASIQDSNPDEIPGVVFLFERTSGTWTQTATLFAPDTASGNRFGFAIGISGPRVVIGATRDDDEAEDAGAAYAFTLSCPDACVADIDDSGDVGLVDLLLVLAHWGPCPGCPEDLDDDAIVGFTDLLVVLAAWGACP